MDQQVTKIIIDDKIPFIRGVFEPYANVEYIAGKLTSKNDVRDASAIVTRTRTKCNEDLLKDSSVKCIASATIGFDHIDTEFCKSNKINWSNAPGCNSGSVAQYITAALISICQRENKMPNQLTLGVVGVGNVGRKVANFAKLLGFKVMLNDPPRARVEGDDKFETLSRLAKKADIITFHTPLTRDGKDKTFHLFNERFLAKLNKQPYIINTSRGEVTCNETLLKGVRKKEIKGIVLDVWENEPNISLDLLKETFIATPHIAGYSVDGKANGTSQSVAYINKCLGLKMETWSPSNLPVPPEVEVKINCKKHNLLSVASKAVHFTYNIEVESDHFKANVANFEDLRGNYPIRREFPAFSVELKQKTDEAVSLISGLGFTII